MKPAPGRPIQAMVRLFRAGQRINDPLVKGYRFCATLQLRTPLTVLRMHGREIAADSDIPAVAALWHGTWLPIIKTWAELGAAADLPEFEPTTMASEVGPVPVDGGELLQLLIRIREVVEADGPLPTRRQQLEALLMVLPQQHFIGLLGGRNAILAAVLPTPENALKN